MTVIEKINNWVKENENNKDLWEKIFVAKILVFYCDNSSLKNQYENILEALMENYSSVFDLLNLFYVTKDKKELKLFMKDEEPNDPLLIATFNEDILKNDNTRAN